MRNTGFASDLVPDCHEPNRHLHRSGVSKAYRLGAIGSSTLREDLNSRLGKASRKGPDPTRKVIPRTLTAVMAGFFGRCVMSASK